MSSRRKWTSGNTPRNSSGVTRSRSTSPSPSSAGAEITRSGSPRAVRCFVHTGRSPLAARTSTCSPTTRPASGTAASVSVRPRSLASRPLAPENVTRPVLTVVSGGCSTMYVRPSVGPSSLSAPMTTVASTSPAGDSTNCTGNAVARAAKSLGRARSSEAGETRILRGCSNAWSKVAGSARPGAETCRLAPGHRSRRRRSEGRRRDARQHPEGVTSSTTPQSGPAPGRARRGRRAARAAKGARRCTRLGDRKESASEGIACGRTPPERPSAG